MCWPIFCFVSQAILKSKSYEHKDMEPPSIEKALQNLRSPVTGVGKFLLRNWIVPKARDAVGQREWGKVSKVVGVGLNHGPTIY